MPLHGQETHPYAVLAGRRERDAVQRRFLGEELVRELNQNTRAVPGFRVAAAGSAMLQIQQNLQTPLDDMVGAFAADVDNKAQTTGIVFMGWMIKPLRGRQV